MTTPQREIRRRRLHVEAALTESPFKIVGLDACGRTGDIDVRVNLLAEFPNGGLAHAWATLQEGNITTLTVTNGVAAKNVALCAPLKEAFAALHKWTDAGGRTSRFPARELPGPGEIWIE